MPTKNINLTEAQAQRIDKLVKSGKFQNVSEYFRALLRRDEERERARRRVETALLEGLAGEHIELDAAEFASIWEEARKRVRRRKSA